MASPREAQVEIHEALVEHFERTSDNLTAAQVSEMTGFPLDETQNALRVLYKSHRIQGIPAAEGDSLVIVTGLVY
jgi:hypothetical protein